MSIIAQGLRDSDRLIPRLADFGFKISTCRSLLPSAKPASRGRGGGGGGEEGGGGGGGGREEGGGGGGGGREEGGRQHTVCVC